MIPSQYTIYSQSNKVFPQNTVPSQSNMVSPQNTVPSHIDLRIRNQRAMIAWSDVRIGDIIQSVPKIEKEEPTIYHKYNPALRSHMSDCELSHIYDPQWTLKHMILVCHKTTLVGGYYKIVSIIKVVDDDRCFLDVRFQPCHELFIDQIRIRLTILSLFPTVLTELILEYLQLLPPNP